VFGHNGDKAAITVVFWAMTKAGIGERRVTEETRAEPS